MGQVRSGCPISRVRSLREVGPFHINQAVQTLESRHPRLVLKRSEPDHGRVTQLSDNPRSRRQAPRRSQPRSGARMKPTAQAVGKLCEKRRSPVGAKENDLLPDVPFVIRNLVVLEEHNKLLLKRPRSMMLFLVRNIPADRRHIRFASAKRPIPGLSNGMSSF